jgi:serine/threonine protein phosphatase 1
MQRLVIGDIHGCYAEFQDLLDKSGLAAGDLIIALGDIVDRGPASPLVLDFFRITPHAATLMGNHERKHVRVGHGVVRPALSQQITRRQMGDEAYASACQYMATLPPRLEYDDALLVHGFVEPGVPLAEQRDNVLVGTLTGESYLQQRCDRPWYELYDGDRPLIVGHHDYLGTGEPLVVRDRVFGIDTGCCHGGRLTALVLPDFRFVSVPSRRDYWAEQRRLHADLRHATTSDQDLTWDRLEQLIQSAHAQSGLPAHARQRLARLQAMFDEATLAVTHLADHLHRIHAEILERLREAGPFDALPPTHQGSLYAAQIADHRLSSFLHRLRKGQLDRERLRHAFPKPADLVVFVRSLRSQENTSP